MDGFDDLLAPSRSVLESNPFEDPFSKRSSSPDPWSSAYQQPSFQDHDAVFGPSGTDSTSPTLEHSPFGVTIAANLSAPSDPLDSLDLTRDDVSEEPLSPTQESLKSEVHLASPGFRESIPATIDEVVASPVVSAQPPLSLPPPIQEEPTPVPAAEPTPTFASDVSQADLSASPSGSPISVPQPIDSSRASTTSLNSSLPPVRTASPPKQQSVFNPLDQPQPTGFGFERPFAGLSIGGESVGGWKGASSPFVSGGLASSANQSEEDDDDDDKPIMQTRANLQVANLSPTPTKPLTEPNGLPPVFVITVDDPQRVGDPIRAYTLYTVHTKTTSPLFSKSSFSVLRRYSDFLWLYEILSLNNPGVVVPPVPEKNAYGFGRFESTFVEQRRAALEKCMMKIAAHPVLQKDTDLKLFLESDTFSLDIKHRKAEMAHEKGGLVASIGQSLTGSRFHETDEWFDKQKGYLDSLEIQLRGLAKTIEALAKHRADVSTAASEFAQALQELSTSDIGPALSTVLAGLADIERKVQESQMMQSNEDIATLMSTVDEYARLISSVRLAFSSRIRVYHAWQNADHNVKRVKQTYEINRAQGKLPADQLSRSMVYVGEVERRALEAKAEFDQVSKLVKSELARFERERIDDFKNSLETFLEGMTSRQKDLIVAWETFQQNLLKKVGNGQTPGQQQLRPTEAATAET